MNLLPQDIVVKDAPLHASDIARDWRR